MRSSKTREAEKPSVETSAAQAPRTATSYDAYSNGRCGADCAVAAAKAERLFSVSESGPWLSMIDDRDF
jgi:hypothetical protein